MDLCNLLWRNRGLKADDPNALGCLIPTSTVNSLTDYLQELNDEPAMSGNEPGKHRYQLSWAFSLSYHVALCGIVAACFKSIEDQSEKEGQSLLVRLTRPVTQKALAVLEKDGGVKVNWQEYRLKTLNWLDERGSEGIGKLMRSTMKALRKG
jgi:centromere protein I